MSVSLDDVNNIARLAKLELNESQQKKFMGQINDILGYMEKLNELDTENVEPLSHTMELSNVFRDDVKKDSLSQEKALENAPLKSDKFFRVPKVVNK